MKVLGWLLLLSIALAALKVAVAVLFVGYLFLLLVGLITHPKETLTLLGYLLLCELANRQGVAFLLALLFLALGRRAMKRTTPE